MFIADIVLQGCLLIGFIIEAVGDAVLCQYKHDIHVQNMLFFVLSLRKMFKKYQLKVVFIQFNLGINSSILVKSRESKYVLLLASRAPASCFMILNPINTSFWARVFVVSSSSSAHSFRIRTPCRGMKRPFSSEAALQPTSQTFVSHVGPLTLSTI